MWQTSSSGVIGLSLTDLDNDGENMCFGIVVLYLFKLTKLVNSNHLKLT